MGCCNEEENDRSIKISLDLYDSYHTSDIVALLLNVYLDKIRAGEMELDFKVVDLINEAGVYNGKR